ncbi:MAG: efflux RND transporter periplasmic adaptor subunit [Colwellia sp.]|nr:efflux RND transporter periplasmic adaptor subunit [Colwellia sp.]MCW8864899.1 efflux RND transporter periplasmic adaptor subunit [Colwellia sp.]MCW9080517.1 efflux RND transporter periplasmic adaptor subunit [Colwellia sp.]
MSNNIKPAMVGVVIGGLLTLGAINLLAPSGSEHANTSVSDEKKPLYWVAPMDANYKKDKPGKSPMGMDLVPVYDDGGKGPDEGPGTIRISSNVINNLGVRTALVSYKSLHTEIKTVGYVTYDEDRLVHIHPRVQGWIEKLHVKAIGDPVKKNQPLYEIYSPELVNAQEELLLAIGRKNSRLISAAENRLAALQLPKAAIVKLKKTKKVQQTITFYSPQNGVVENLKIREGFFVKPGSTLMSIGDLSEVWVEAEVFERQAGQVKTGTPVTMTLDYLPGKAWQGQVDYIYPTLDAKTRTVKVRLRFNNETGEFKPNMFAQIAIHTTADEQALLIPKEALIRTGNQDRVVLALGEGSFKSVAVSVGRFDSENVEILAGLKEGEKIVSSAQFLLDSESSKSSDFKRMHSDETESAMSGMAMNNMDMAENDTGVSSATATGTINSLMIAHGMINISRSAIEKWNRPAATVDFVTADGVSLEGFNQGMAVKFTFEVRNGNFVIVEISPLTSVEQANNASDEEAVIDHLNH